MIFSTTSCCRTTFTKVRLFEVFDIIELDRRRCPTAKEWIKIYYLLLIVPVVAAIASGCISMILLEKADWKDIITISFTVGAGFLALQSVLRRSLWL